MQGFWQGEAPGHDVGCGTAWGWQCDCSRSQEREDESVGCCGNGRRCDNPYHRTTEWPEGCWPCSFNASPDRPSGVYCDWYVAAPDDPRGTPYRLGHRCEEHACLSCRQFPCAEDCLGEQLYECAQCRRLFMRFQISRVGAADLCSDCGRHPMRQLGGGMRW